MAGKFGKIVCAATALAVLSACGGESPLTPAAGRSLEIRAKGSLFIYSDAASDAMNLMIEAFHRSNPEVAVEIIRAVPGTPLNQIFGEYATPRPDIYVTMDVPLISSNEALFEVRNTEMMARVPKNLRSPNCTWTAVTLRPYVVIYNTGTVQAADAPKALTDITDKKWRGQLALPDGSSWLMLSNITLLQRQIGDDKALAFARELAGANVQWHKQQSDVVAAVRTGKARIGVVSLTEAYKGIRDGASIGYQYLETNGNVLADSVNVAINKRATNLRNARLFLDFVLSGDTQQRVADGNHDVPVMLGVQLAQGVKPLSPLKMTPVPITEIAERSIKTRELLLRAGIP